MTNLTMLARDRFKLTKQALDSLRVSGTEGMSVTLVDDRSVDPTRLLLKLCGAWVNETPTGTGQLRNLAVAKSEEHYGRGDYLYLSDNDVYFKPGWLEQLAIAYTLAYGYGFRALGAYNHPFHKPTMTLPLTDKMCVHEVNALASQSMLMRWTVWDQFGPFVETPVDKVCQSEDHAFSQKIREAGFKVGVVSPALVINTGITNSFGEHIPGWELVKASCPQGVICE